MVQINFRPSAGFSLLSIGGLGRASLAAEALQDGLVTDASSTVADGLEANDSSAQAYHFRA